MNNEVNNQVTNNNQVQTNNQPVVNPQSVVNSQPAVSPQAVSNSKPVVNNQNTNPVAHKAVSSSVINNISTNPQPVVNNTPTNTVNSNNEEVEYEYVEQKKSHKGILFILLLLIIIGGMGYYIYTDYQKDLKNKCSPLITENNKKNNLKLDSTIVQDLYQKVKTDIDEDIASTEFDDKMKLYLAYRQVPNYQKYESNCNLFNEGSMQFITCDSSSGYLPMAIKEEDLQREVKKLFGEDAVIENNNIQLGNSCLGGYQYIAERGEYVQGQCNNTTNSIYRVDKKLISAYAYNDTIVLKEKVRYFGEQNVDIDRLKNGVYTYTFKLDNNYNYVLISKEIE